MVKRYALWPDGIGTCSEGPYTLHADYKALRQELEAVKAERDAARYEADQLFCWRDQYREEAAKVDKLIVELEAVKRDLTTESAFATVRAKYLKEAETRAETAEAEVTRLKERLAGLENLLRLARDEVNDDAFVRRIDTALANTTVQEPQP